MIYCYTHMVRALRIKVAPGDQKLSEAEKKRHERFKQVRRNVMKTLGMSTLDMSTLEMFTLEMSTLEMSILDVHIRITCLR